MAFHFCPSHPCPLCRRDRFLPDFMLWGMAPPKDADRGKAKAEPTEKTAKEANGFA